MPRSGYRRAFTTPEPDVPLRPESMFHFPESMFHFRRKPCSTSAEIGVPLPPKNPPDGVVVEPGRIEVRFGEPSEALTALHALAQALIADYDGFEAIVRR